MVEVDGVKYLEKSDMFREVKARWSHVCNLCGGEIKERELYYHYKDRATGWEKKSCARHVDEERIRQFELVRQKYIDMRQNGKELRLETDASGPEGERWAFIVYVSHFEIHRQRGCTPPEVKAITPAEGYAVCEALEWLHRAEQDGTVEADLPVIVGSDNSAVARKLQTQSEWGNYKFVWERMNQLLRPYRREGRLFIEGVYSGEAHGYAQKWE